MGRDLRAPQKGMNVRAKLYSSQITSSNEVIRKLIHVTPIVFYARDVVPFGYVYDELSGIQMKPTLKGTIETYDLKQSDIKLYDTVEYEDKSFDVEEITFEDNNVQKQLSSRPMVKTTIKLQEIKV